MTSEEEAFLRAIRASPNDDNPRLVYADWLEDKSGMEKCETCGGAGEHEQFMMAGPHSGELKKVPIGLQPCADCDGVGWIPDEHKIHAELIRVQCEIAGNFQGVPPASEENDRRQDYLLVRERQLLGKHAKGEWGRNHWRLFVKHFAFLGNRLGDNDNGPRIRRGFIETVRIPLDARIYLRSVVQLPVSAVTAVEVSDRNPDQLADVFRWSTDLERYDEPPTCRLPHDLFEKLDGFVAH